MKHGGGRQNRTGQAETLRRSPGCPARPPILQCGASGRARTCDKRLIGPLLYQLSYRCVKLVANKKRWPRDRFHGGRNAPHNPHTWPREIATSPWGLRCKIRGLLVKSQALAAVLQPVSRPPLAQWDTLLLGGADHRNRALSSGLVATCAPKAVLASLTGFEPASTCLKGRGPNQLDDRDKDFFCCSDCSRQ